MNREDSKKWICTAWENWEGRKNPSSYQDMLTFFVETQKERPEFFEFPSTGDRWQIVKAWLADYEQRHARRVVG